jgi:hypothetical protein
MQVGHIIRERYREFLQAGGGFGPDDNLPSYPDDYVMVAVVEGDSVDMAYQLTNHIDHAWWENAGVTLIGEPEHRSTSVGDVVVMDDGRVLRCANCGWDEMEVSDA